MGGVPAAPVGLDALAMSATLAPDYLSPVRCGRVVRPETGQPPCTPRGQRQSLYSLLLPSARLTRACLCTLLSGERSAAYAMAVTAMSGFVRQRK
ncbi:MAG: hypothetical protein RMJ19_06740 [Gemmatales bacterium]|nr:hypothetical protein [Gemmatales bacterium]MDW8175352.1 hypothetical protein [Gemmatales bacterium]